MPDLMRNAYIIPTLNYADIVVKKKRWVKSVVARNARIAVGSYHLTKFVNVMITKNIKGQKIKKIVQRRHGRDDGCRGNLYSHVTEIHLANGVILRPQVIEFGYSYGVTFDIELTN